MELSKERIEWLRGILDQGPVPLFATVSGAHLYGFESPDSDYDLRGAFIAPLTEVLRPRRTNETHSILEVRDGLELDWVAHDVAKFARLMTRANGYVLEQLYSPLVVFGNEWHEELKAIGASFITSGLHRHYAGFIRNQRKRLSDGDETVKRVLYCYRVLLTGIHVLRTGCIESNLTALNSTYELAELPELLVRKREGLEKGALLPGEAEQYQSRLDELERHLHHAHDSCTLAEMNASSIDQLDDFVVRVRLEHHND